MANSTALNIPSTPTDDQLAGINARYDTVTAEEILLDALAQPWFSPASRGFFIRR